MKPSREKNDHTSSLSSGVHTLKRNECGYTRILGSPETLAAAAVARSTSILNQRKQLDCSGYILAASRRRHALPQLNFTMHMFAWWRRSGAPAWLNKNWPNPDNVCPDWRSVVNNMVSSYWGKGTEGRELRSLWLERWGDQNGYWK